MIEFIEVKTRLTMDFGRPCEAVGPGKQERMRRVAAYYTTTHGMDWMEIRFQVIEILINQIRDAF